jgi:hypothetical protein
MKKLRLLTLLALPAAVTPFLAAMTSCTTLGDIKLVELNSDSFNGQTYGQVAKSNADFKDLIYGTSSFHGGNYCIFIANSQANSFYP